jgi:hypothetical protein
MTKIYKDKKNKNERLSIVLDIVKKLKSFHSSDHTIIDLYNSQFPTIVKLKSIFNEYINQDDTHPSLIYGLNGSVKFPEINKKIIYTLPVKKDSTPTFILRSI